MKFSKTTISLALASCSYLPGLLWAADDTEELRDQLNTLKDEIVILQDQLEETNVANANRMNISGYADIEYHSSTANDSEPGFRLHHMSLFFEKRVTDEWKFFSEIEYEDAPFMEYEYVDSGSDSACEGCYGKIFLEAANFTYAWHPTANLRAGRFFTPAGIWSVDHYPSFVPTQLRPEHIRRIFPQVVDGVSAFGTLPMGSSFINYDLYIGNGEGNSGSADSNSEKATGIKLSLILPFFRYLEVGSSAYNDTSTDTLDANTKKTAFGAHMKLKFSSFTLQTEYAKADIEPDSGGSYSTSGYYAQLLYDVNKWTFGVRHDVYDENDTLDQQITLNSGFINYHVNEAIIVKLEHHNVTDEDVTKEDYSHTIASVVLYLGN